MVLHVFSVAFVKSTRLISFAVLLYHRMGSLFALTIRISEFLLLLFISELTSKKDSRIAAVGLP